MKSIRMGLVLDRHLEQLSKIMNHGRQVFASRPQVADFFGSLETVVHLEQQRRQHSLEGQWDESPWEFDFDRLTPSAQICIYEFFRGKQEEFTGEEPPIASFFNQVANHLNRYMKRELPEDIKDKVEEAHETVLEEKETRHFTG
ncbi:MAG: hypothetical protein ACQEP7_01440 [bacterium]